VQDLMTELNFHGNKYLFIGDFKSSQTRFMIIDGSTVESTLIGYSVLMITNLNDEYTWVSWPKQIANRPYNLTMQKTDWLQLRIGWNQDTDTVCKNRIRSVPQLRLTVTPRTV